MLSVYQGVSLYFPFHFWPHTSSAASIKPVLNLSLYTMLSKQIREDKENFHTDHLEMLDILYRRNNTQIFFSLLFSELIFSWVNTVKYNTGHCL
jgi:hypothetical protein